MTAATKSKFAKTATASAATATARPTRTRMKADRATTQAAYQGSTEDTGIDAQTAAAEDLAAARDRYLEASNVPTGRRLLVATLSGLIASASSVYFAMPMIELATFAAVAFSGSAFLGFLIWFVGAVLAIWASVIGGAQVFSWVTSFNTEAALSAARDVKAASLRRVSLVRDWFKPTPVVAE